MPTLSEQRPDPDQLLAKVKREEADARRGKLRIYFGSSAGVGKTYAMLVAGRNLKADGRDVVIGIVETHGRTETAALYQVARVARTRHMDPAKVRQIVLAHVEAPQWGVFGEPRVNVLLLNLDLDRAQ